MIRVTFDGGTADTMPWKFRPTQGDVKVIASAVARIRPRLEYTHSPAEALIRLVERSCPTLESAVVIHMEYLLGSSPTSWMYVLRPPPVPCPWAVGCVFVAPKVVPGETALAFFTAKNPTKKHITGVATYNVFPLKAGKCPLPGARPPLPVIVIFFVARYCRLAA